MLSSDTHHWFDLLGLLTPSGLGMYYLLNRRNYSDSGPGSASAISGGSEGGAADEEYIDLQTVLFDSARQEVQAGDANQVIKRAYIAVRQAVNEAKVHT